MSEQAYHSLMSFADDVTEYIVLHIDELCLLLPLSEVFAQESAEEVTQNGDRNAGTVGTYIKDELYYPVYALNQHLQLQAELPEKQTECVLLNDSVNQFAILCDSFEMVERSLVQISSLPVRMQKAGSPINALAVYAGKIGSITNTAQLHKFLSEKVVHH